MQPRTTKRVLLVTDEQALRPETLRYSISLAQRTDACVTVLIVRPHDDAVAEEVSERAAVLRARVEVPAGPGGITAVALRFGDPRSEVLKFLAGRPTFHTIVWGGDPAVTSGRAIRRGGHWVHTLLGGNYCPLVTPRRRQRSGTSPEHEAHPAASSSGRRDADHLDIER